jgi:hypothetical protein
MGVRPTCRIKRPLDPSGLGIQRTFIDSQHAPNYGILGHMKSRNARRVQVWVAANLAVATVLTACGFNARAIADTPCPHPAPIDNHLDPAMPSLMVIIRKDADVFSVAARLAKDYSVQPRLLPAIHMLVLNPVSAALVERLRCDPDIAGLSYDVATHIG